MREAQAEEEHRRRYYLTVAIWGAVCVAVGILIWLVTRTPPPPPEPTVTVTMPAPSPSPTAYMPPITPTIDTPVDVVRKYYEHMSADRFAEAYEMRSRKSRAETSFEFFKDTWRNNIEVRVQRATLSARKESRARVDLWLLSTDRATDGSVVTLCYKGPLDLVLEGGRWRYDGFHHTGGRPASECSP